MATLYEVESLSVEATSKTSMEQHFALAIVSGIPDAGPPKRRAPIEQLRGQIAAWCTDESRLQELLRRLGERTSAFAEANTRFRSSLLGSERWQGEMFAIEATFHGAVPALVAAPVAQEVTVEAIGVHPDAGMVTARHHPHQVRSFAARLLVDAPDTELRARHVDHYTEPMHKWDSGFLLECSIVRRARLGKREHAARGLVPGEYFKATLAATVVPWAARGLSAGAKWESTAFTDPS